LRCGILRGAAEGHWLRSSLVAGFFASAAVLCGCVEEIVKGLRV
jgi:hypothetical protein